MRGSFSSLTLFIGKLIEVILFPSRCKLCSAFLEKPGERIICQSCWERVTPFRSSFCLCCGRFFEASKAPTLCSSCLEAPPPFSLHRSCGKYERELKDIIILYKYRRFRPLGEGLGRFALHALGKEESLWWGVEGIIPVPLHPRRERERGFNQAKIIAEELARGKKIELWDGILVRVENVPPQTSLEAEERKRNVRGVFRVKKSEKIKDRVVLLVDDVYTTGSTVKECSLELRKAGAREVRVITLAQA